MIDFPRRCEVGLYDRAIERVIDALADDEGVVSIFQIGDIRHPGISDIDLLVIVDETVRSTANPLHRLSVGERRLFTHGCFALPQPLVADVATYLPFRNYRPLFGHNWSLARAQVALPHAVATEFLIRNLLDVYTQVEYRIIKVRSLLQHVKAMQLDLTLLELADAELNALVDDVVEKIEGWFVATPSPDYLVGAATRLLDLLLETVSRLTGHEALCCPAESGVAIAPNVKIVHGSDLQLRRRGIRMPVVNALGERRLFNLNHRFNSYTLQLPLRPPGGGTDEWNRFELFRKAKSFAQTHRPAFTAPISALFYYGL